MKTCSWHIHHGLCTQQRTEYTNITASTSRMKILLRGICLFQVTQVISVTSNILKKLCYNVDFWRRGKLVKYRKAPLLPQRVGALTCEKSWTCHCCIYLQFIIYRIPLSLWMIFTH